MNGQLCASLQDPGRHRARPLQNRVTPFGEIVSIAQRGLFTGNRGILHDPATLTLRRRWAGKAWLVCTCDYKGRRRNVMGRRSWTELFFLDEAVALAAGHRPCFTCRREAAERFRAAWTAARGGPRPSAKTIDAVLHIERLESGGKRAHPLPCAVGALPDGTMVAAGKIAFTICGGRAWRWCAGGYEPGALAAPDMLLTPPSTLGALRMGYRPALHPAIEGDYARSL